MRTVRPHQNERDSFKMEIRPAVHNVALCLSVKPNKRRLVRAHTCGAPSYCGPVASRSVILNLSPTPLPGVWIRLSTSVASY